MSEFDLSVVISTYARPVQVREAIAAIVAAGGKGGKVNKSGEGLSYAMVADNEGNPIELLLRQ